MGVNIAPEIYQRKISEILEGIESVLIYMENHDILLNEVINVTKHSGLKLNKDKCIFNANEFEFLGHLVTESGVTIISLSKIDAVNRLERPNNVKAKLQRLIGMINF